MEFQHYYAITGIKKDNKNHKYKFNDKGTTHSI